MLVGGLLSAGAAAISMIDGQSIGHPALFPALAFGLNAAALVARILPQKGLPNGE